MEQYSEEMNAQLLKTIEQHMPQQICGAFARRLEELEGIEKDYDKVVPALEKAQEEIKELRRLKNTKERLDTRADDLQGDIRRLQAERTAFEMTKRTYELEQQLSAEQRITAHTMAVNLNLTRNVETRKNLLGTVPVPVEGQAPDSNGNYGMCGSVENVPINNTEIETTE